MDYFTTNKSIRDSADKACCSRYADSNCRGTNNYDIQHLQTDCPSIKSITLQSAITGQTEFIRIKFYYGKEWYNESVNNCTEE